MDQINIDVMIDDVDIDHHDDDLDDIDDIDDDDDTSTFMN